MVDQSHVSFYVVYYVMSLSCACLYSLVFSLAVASTFHMICLWRQSERCCDPENLIHDWHRSVADSSVVEGYCCRVLSILRYSTVSASSLTDRVVYREIFGAGCVFTAVSRLVTFRVSRRRREIYWSHASVSVCLSVSVAACPHYCTDPDVTWGNGSECPPSSALLGGFAIGARVSLPSQRSANAKC